MIPGPVVWPNIRAPRIPQHAQHPPSLPHRKSGPDSSALSHRDAFPAVPTSKRKRTAARKRGGCDWGALLLSPGSPDRKGLISAAGLNHVTYLAAVPIQITPT